MKDKLQKKKSKVVGLYLYLYLYLLISKCSCAYVVMSFIHYVLGKVVSLCLNLWNVQFQKNGLG